jgi:tetratricopeptide (TPR) repeat protein
MFDQEAAARVLSEAEVLRTKGDDEGAIRLYAEAIETNPHVAWLYLRGTALLERGDRRAAASDFEAALRLDPSNPTLLFLVQQAKGAVVDPDKAARLQKEGEARRSTGDLAGAIKLYSEAIEVSPPNTALFYIRGATLLEAGDPAAAARDLEAGLALEPGNAALQKLLDQARQKESAPDPARASKLQFEVDIWRACGDYAAAVGAYGQAIQSNPSNPALYFLRGTAYLESGLPAAALKDFEAALELDPMNIQLITLRREARAELRRTE